jgi:hypothetical protein
MEVASLVVAQLRKTHERPREKEKRPTNELTIVLMKMVMGKRYHPETVSRKYHYGELRYSEGEKTSPQKTGIGASEGLYDG